MESVGSHCGPEGQICRCRTLKRGKEPMQLLEDGGDFFKSVNRVSQARSPSDSLSSMVDISEIGGPVFGNE